MFARPGARHHQIAYVTNDLRAARVVFEKQYGIASFFEFSNVKSESRKQNAPELRIALAHVNGVEIELIEPVGGSVEIFKNALPNSAELAIRFHHIAIRIDGALADWQRHEASIDTETRKIVFAGALGDDLRYFYTDERATLGHYVEHIWMSPSLLKQMDAAIPCYPSKSPAP